MEQYEYWLQVAENVGLHVIEDVPFESRARGIIYGNCIALSHTLSSATEKTCVLAEEVIHSQMNVGDILDQRSINNAKQEHATRMALHKELASLYNIAKFLKQGYRQSYELAEKLGVTEEFLVAAIDGYRQKYGLYVRVGDDTLLLEPTVALLSQIQQTVAT